MSNTLLMQKSNWFATQSRKADQQTKQRNDHLKWEAPWQDCVLNRGQMSCVWGDSWLDYSAIQAEELLGTQNVKWEKLMCKARWNANRKDILPSTHPNRDCIWDVLRLREKADVCLLLTRKSKLQLQRMPCWISLHVDHNRIFFNCSALTCLESAALCHSSCICSSQCFSLWLLALKS